MNITCVMASGEVVGGVFFAADELLRVEIARGTCFSSPISLKKVFKALSLAPTGLSLGIGPSGCETIKINKKHFYRFLQIYQI